jgi:hypothetical protein
MFDLKVQKYSAIDKVESVKGDITLMTTELEDNLALDKSKSQIWQRKYPTGWRFAVATCFISTVTVLIINLSLMLYSISHYGRGDGGIQTLYAGSCSRARGISASLHLLINVLSTILLASSNYCMQCLSAPTRSEVDVAHSKKIWLDIGVPSTKNLLQIGRKRLVLWCLLGFSSILVHLL